VQTATVEDVFARIDEIARKEPGGAIATDGDGTLWSGDIGEDFFEALVEHGRFESVAHEAMVREATLGKLDASGTAVDVARRIHAAYLDGTFDEERVCEIMTWAFAGWPQREVDAFAATVFERAAVRDRLHGETIAAVGLARARGIDVYLVSASPRAIVEEAARHIGIDPACIVAATERCDAHGVVLAEVHRPIPYGPGKVAHLEQRLGDRPLYAAFGDNAFDVAMLRKARVPVAIRPKARLVERAAEVPGLVILEKR
jgi:phosphatidylglycerophosphatase C